MATKIIYWNTKGTLPGISLELTRVSSLWTKCLIRLARFNEARKSITALKDSTFKNILNLELCLAENDGIAGTLSPQLRLCQQLTWMGWLVKECLENLKTAEFKDYNFVLEACRILYEKQEYEESVFLLSKHIEICGDKDVSSDCLLRLFTISALLDSCSAEKIVEKNLFHGT